MASLPRELLFLRYEHVVKSLASNLRELASFTCQEDGEGSFTLSTLGIRPVKELLELRKGARARHIAASILHTYNKSLRLPIQSRTWELEFDAHLTSACAAINILLQHSSSELTKCASPELQDE
jgi:beta-fructofuranosidase